MASLYFSKSYSQNADLGSLLVVIPPVNSKRMLLVELSQKLQFPDYFGFNWDALYDLLCECYGIKEKNITIFHESVKDIPVTDLLKYLDVIQATCEWWKGYEDHNFFFVFNSNEKDHIMNLVNNNKYLFGIVIHSL